MLLTFYKPEKENNGLKGWQTEIIRVRPKIV